MEKLKNLYKLMSSESLYIIRDWIYRLGNLATFNIPKSEIIFVKDAHDSITLMKTKYKTTKVIDVFSKVAPSSVFNQQPDKWKEYRNKHPLTIIDNNWIKRQQYTLENTIIEWCNMLSKERSINFQDSMYKLVFCIMCKTFLGRDYDENLFNYFDFQTYSVNHQLKFNTSPLSPRFHYMKRKWFQSLEHVVQNRSCEGTDLISELVRMDYEFDDDLIGELSGLFWGGMLSLTSTIVTSLYHLSAYPDQYDYLLKDLENRSLAVIKESMRMFPGVPIVIRSVKPQTVLTLSNHKFEEGSSIAFCPFALHNDPTYWNNPDRFDITRFENHAGYFSNAYMPFGVPVEEGGRSCVGSEYALFVASIVIKTICRSYIFKIDTKDNYKIKSYAGSIVPVNPIIGTIIQKNKFMDKSYDNKIYVDTFHKILFFLNKNKFRDNKIYTVDDIEKDVLIDENIINLAKSRFFMENIKLHHINKKNINTLLNDHVLDMTSNFLVHDLSNQWINKNHAFQSIENYCGIELNDHRIKRYFDISQKLAKMSTVNFCEFLVSKGKAAHLLKYDNIKNEYYVDLLYMFNFKVRNKLLPYGAKLVLTDKLKVKHISIAYTSIFKMGKVIDYYARLSLYTPNDIHWQFAYNIFVSSLLAHVTIVDHTINCHFMMTGNILCSHYTNCHNMHHDLYKLLKTFLFKTSDINSTMVKILINRGGIINRIFAFTSRELDKFITYHLTNFNYNNLFSFFKYNNLPITTPFMKDAKKYLHEITLFIEKYIDFIYPGEIINEKDFVNYIDKTIPGFIDHHGSIRHNIIKIVTVHIFNVSFWHEQIGNMASYVLDPTIIKSKVYKKCPSAKLDSQQNTLQNIHLSFLTSIITMPRMIDDLWKVNNYKYKHLWVEFIEHLNNISFNCEHLSPKFLECSVSL